MLELLDIAIWRIPGTEPISCAFSHCETVDGLDFSESAPRGRFNTPAVSDIMAEKTPPVRWLFGDAEQRRIARRYWLRDPAVGAAEFALHRAMRLMPIDMCSYSGAAITYLTRLQYPESERRARKVWAALRPGESDPATVDAAMDRLWRNVGRTMHEYSIIDRLWAAGRIEVRDIEHLHRARDEGKPILVAPVHLGNWEAILVAGIACGHCGSGIYEPPQNRFEHRIANAVRARYGARFVAAGPNSVREAVRELKARDGPFTVYIDEFIRGRVQAPSFGRPLRPDANIAYAVRLATMTGAALIPAYCVRLDDSARFRVQFLPPLPLASTDARKADIAENVRRLDAVIAPIIQAHLDQWYFALDFEFDK
jgi:KDO2-lipid IV(A) lauroyltransferase